MAESTLAASGTSASGARARAWCRADLAGGTFDIWPLGLLHRGARTINLALDLAVEVEVVRSHGGYRVVQDGSVVCAASGAELAVSGEGALVGLIAEELELPPVEIEIRSASPRGGGLGASSALAVAVIAAAELVRGDEPSSVEARAALARDLEARLMNLPTGRQDHFAAQLGGMLEIRHRPGGEQVQRLRVDFEALAASLLVAYTGESHVSAATNWRIIHRRMEADRETIRCFDGIRDAAEEMADSLARGRFARVGELMKQEWSWRRRLAEGISTPAIERLLEAAEAVGGWGGKACGAGGGGCIVVLGPAERVPEMAAALSRCGATILPTRPVDRPLRVEPIPEDG